MNRFDYLAPTSLTEVLALLSDRPEALPLAGGTDLLVQIKEHRRPVEALLSLKRVPEVEDNACQEHPELSTRHISSIDIRMI